MFCVYLGFFWLKLKGNSNQTPLVGLTVLQGDIKNDETLCVLCHISHCITRPVCKALSSSINPAAAAGVYNPDTAVTS